MFRFPYLLSFLICIELSFCYNYIDKATEHNREDFGRNLRRDKVRRVKRPIIQRNPVHQEEDYDKSPVEFDVASFIQPERENSEADEFFTSHKIKRRRWNEKPFDIGSMMKNDDINSKLEKSPDYMSMGGGLPELNMNQPLSKDLLNVKHFSYNPLEDLNAGKYGHEKFRNIHKDGLLRNPNEAHKKEKKCSLKTLKFPFFSHNKSETIKPKRNKKRKLFFNNFKKERQIPNLKKMSDDTMIPYKIKRSYEQRLCPACKKLFVASMEYVRPRKNLNKIIHNSRQFYQNTLPDATLKEDIRDFKTNKISNTSGKFRMKRHEGDRQLKELEEVQKKVEAVQISVPHLIMTTEKDVEDN